MKERGGGNQTDRPRWAGDGLLEIWGGPELLADLERVQLFGTAHSCAGAGAGARATAPHHRAPTPSHLHLFFSLPTGQFSVSERATSSRPTAKVSKLHRYPPSQGRTAGRARQGSQTAGVETDFRSSSPLLKQQAASSQPSAQPCLPPSRPFGLLCSPAWALTEVIHSLAYLAA